MHSGTFQHPVVPAPIDEGLGARLPGLVRSLQLCVRGAGWVAVSLVLEEPDGPHVLTWPASAIRDLRVAAAPGREALDTGTVLVRPLDPAELSQLGIDGSVRACAAAPVRAEATGTRAAVTAWSRGPASPELVAQVEAVAELLEGPLSRLARQQVPWQAYAELVPHLEGLPVGVVVLDSDGAVRTWSSGATELLGLPESTALGRPLVALGLDLPEPLLAGVRPIRAQLRGSSQERLALVGPRGVDGRQLEWTLAPGPGGEFLVALVRVRGEVADEQPGAPCGALAHELNNALTGILLSAELLGASLDADDAGADHVRRLLGSTRRATSLGALLTMASGCPGLGREPIDVATVAVAAVDRLRAVAPDGCELDLALGGGALVVRADERQLDLAVAALLDNATEALGTAGGTVATTVDRLHLPADPEALPGSVLGRGGDFVRVAVRDDGSGMAGEVLSRCTRPFYSTRKTRLGLGLAAVQGLADASGGALFVHSRPGQGTRVELWLPAGS